MEFDHAQAQAAAADLDKLADRLEADLHTNSPLLQLEPAGRDEVSRRAADTSSAVGASYDKAGHGGVLEMRKLAAALRSHSANLAHTEADNVANISGVRG